MLIDILLSKRVFALFTVIVICGATAAVAIPALTSQQVIYDANSVHLRIIRSAADGFDSGWHIHPGVAIVQVQQGSFQITQGSCTPTTVSAGQTFIEVPYLAVRAVATGHIEWTTTQITDGNNAPQVAWTQYSPGAKDPCS
jgi:hypothetical protein